jgi:cell wall-associated NlpC family hydrolase
MAFFYFCDMIYMVDNMSKKKNRKKKNISSNNIIIISILIIVVIILFSYFIGRDNVSTLTIELNGDSSITVYNGSKYDDPGAKAYDEENKDLSDEIKITNNVDIYKSGRYEIIYSLGDISVKRVVRVIDKPIANNQNTDKDDNKEINDKKSGETAITLKGSETVYIELYGNYKEEGFTAVDTVDGNIKKKVKVTHNVDNKKPGIYQVVYTVKNSSGITTSVSRQIIVMKVDMNLSLSNSNYTNGDVGIKVNVDDEYFDYLILPNGVSTNDKSCTYTVNGNGTYTFKLFNKGGVIKEKSITVNNIDKVSPTASCKAEYKNGKTVVTVSANDNVGISNYVVNGKNHLNNVINIDSFVSDNSVVVYDASGNSASCKCSVTSSVNVDSITNDGVLVTVKASAINATINGYYFSYDKNIPDKNTGGYVATSNGSIEIVRLPGTTYVWAEDNYGNVSGYKTITLNNDVIPMTMSGYTVLKGTKLGDFLKSRGSSIEEFNKLMARSVRAAGVYTKKGAATAGVALQVVLAQKYGVKVPYWRGGKTNSIGAYGSWGMYYENPTYEGYYYYGMDCDGFVNWSFHNTGIVYQDILNNSYYYWKGLPLTKENGEVGDVIRRDGHVSLIVGKTSDAFIIAEAYGEKVGMIMNKHYYTTTNGYTIIKGENLISTYGHLSSYPTGY